MQFLSDALHALPEYGTLCAALRAGRVPVSVSGLAHIHKALLTASLYRGQKRPLLLVTADDAEAIRFHSDLIALGLPALCYTARDYMLRPAQGVSKEYEHRRLSVLSVLAAGGGPVVVSPVDALTQYTLPPDALLARSLSLAVGQDIALESVVATLLSAGYTRAEEVEGVGQFARRGGILDVFAPDSEQPLRVEFWGDTVDGIAPFDPLTQRRGEPVTAAQFGPAAELPVSDPAGLAAQILALLSRQKSPSPALVSSLTAAADTLNDGLPLHGTDRFLPLLLKKPATLLDYLEKPLILASEPAAIRERMRTTEWQQNEDITTLLEEGLLCGELTALRLTPAALSHALQRQDTLLLDSFAHGKSDLTVKEMISISLRQLPVWGGGFSLLLDDLLPALDNHYACIILAGSKKAALQLTGDLLKEGLSAHFAEHPKQLPARGQILVTGGALSGGFDLIEQKLLCITHGQLNIVSRKRLHDAKNKNARRLSSLEELSVGDYVVHTAHGIGIFDGIHQMIVQGATKDYIKIRYVGADVLYVPVTQLDLVAKYIGNTEGGLKLNRLGGTGWQKTKSRVRAAVRDMADELIALYAKRMSTSGHAFGADTDLQNDFDRRFEYEETDDQLQCIEEIKQDMQRPVPMDRLLCGDVGFGKTEVALRGAFKCISEGKQCVILVPTTILAWQHYQTVLSRMQMQAVNVEMLSRFRTPAMQSQIIKRLRTGEIDLVIGTHRVISKDVQFRDLGLVIVDEEQRFGVGQKERLKELFPTVDVLTLSATPIPRTLNMAMSGIRDMSTIEEAPHDRQPVQTYVLEYDSGVLYDAIRKEMRRGGQVYYLHNRVESITGVATRIGQVVEGCRVGIAHGKMSEEELSAVWKRLMDSELDVLVCTTIIETGVDVSNVNTLIIEDADKMGLAQLHQIRGRVGRSHRRAYAYLTFRRGKALTDIATKRLEAIRDFTEFGAGFKIALRDLEIRGAGNILGGQQSGHMEAVGYDMYLKLLSDAVAESKGEPTAPDNDCLIDLPIDAHIPEEYIPHLPTRLSIYRRIASIHDSEDAGDAIDELTDRFGDLPAAVLGLIDIALVRSAAARAGITEITQNEGSVLLYPTALDMEMVSKMAAALKGRVLLSAGAKPYIAVRLKKGEGTLLALKVVLGI